MTQPAEHHDDYSNMASGLGGPRDPSSRTIFVEKPPLAPAELIALYKQNSLATRIIDRVVDDATREPFTLEGVDQAYDTRGLMSELEEIDALNALGDGWRWARLYGGALVVMALDDGIPMEAPYVPERASSIKALHVIEAPYARAASYRPGLGSRAFRNPDHYEITASAGDAGVVSRRIHRSRVIRFDGTRVPPSELVKGNGWGPSVLDRVQAQLRRLGLSEHYAENILHSISILVLKMAELRKRLLGSEEDKRTMRAAFEEIRRTMDNLGLLVIDNVDDFKEQTRSIAGLDALLQRFVDALVRVTDMPRTILLGEQPGGLNANSDAEIRGWFDHVALQQKRILTPAITQLLKVLLPLRAKRTGQPAPNTWTIGYASLWQPSEKERADTRLVTAQADGLDITNLVQSAEEVRARRVADGDITPLVAPQPEAAGAT